MLVSQRIPSFLGGVSQQDERLRDPSQGSLQLNSLSSVANGLTKRPPAVFDSQIEDNVAGYGGSALSSLRSPTG